MPVIVGIVLALGVAAFAALVRLDRDRAFYPTVTMVVASYYVLFAVSGGTTRSLVVESAIGVLFVACAAYGFRSSLWLVVATLAAHGILDLFHPGLVSNAGVPTWWPAFCSAYDVSAAAYLAWALRSGRIRATVPIGRA